MNSHNSRQPHAKPRECNSPLSSPSDSRSSQPSVKRRAGAREHLPAISRLRLGSLARSLPAAPHKNTTIAARHHRVDVSSVGTGESSARVGRQRAKSHFHAHKQSRFNQCIQSIRWAGPEARAICEPPRGWPGQPSRAVVVTGGARKRRRAVGRETWPSAMGSRNAA